MDVEDLNKRSPITALVDKQVVIDNVEEAKRHAPGKIYPSSVHKCSRELCYELLGYPREVMIPRVLRILDNGNYMHERYQSMWKRMGIMIAEEVPIKDESLRISGRMDALLEIEGNSVIGELKSAGSSPFGKMKSANKPQEKFIAQIQLYLHLSNVDFGVLFIENKNDQDILEFWVQYDEEYCKQLFTKLHMAREFADRKEIIPRETAEKIDLFMMDQKKMLKCKYDEYCYYCRYCDYKSFCYKK